MEKLVGQLDYNVMGSHGHLMAVINDQNVHSSLFFNFSDSGWYPLAVFYRQCPVPLGRFLPTVPGTPVGVFYRQCPVPLRVFFTDSARYP